EAPYVEDLDRRRCAPEDARDGIAVASRDERDGAVAALALARAARKTGDEIARAHEHRAARLSQVEAEEQAGHAHPGGAAEPYRGDRLRQVERSLNRCRVELLGIR